MQNEKKFTVESHERVQNLAGKAFTVFSYATAITLGALVGQEEIRRLSYKHFAAAGHFDTMQKIRDADIEIKLAVAEKEPHASSAKAKGFKGLLSSLNLNPPSETSIAIGKIKEDYRQKVKKWYVEHDMHGLRDYIEPLQKNDRIKVATEAFTVAGIALGVLLTVANSKGLSKVLTKEDDSPANTR